MNDSYDSVSTNRLERKNDFVSTIMDLQYTTSALREYFEYCVANEMFCDGLIIGQLAKGALPSLDNIPEEGNLQ